MATNPPTNGQWVQVARRNEPDDLPIGYLDNRYIKVQKSVAFMSPEKEWWATHNLGGKPEVVVVLEDNVVAEIGYLEYVTDDVVLIKHDDPQSGVVYFVM